MKDIWLNEYWINYICVINCIELVIYFLNMISSSWLSRYLIVCDRFYYFLRDSFY